MAEAGPTPHPRHISYVTDIEGNVDYFFRWVAESRAVSWKQPNLPPTLPAAAGTESSGQPPPSTPASAAALEDDFMGMELELAPDHGVVFGGDLFDKGPGVFGLFSVVMLFGTNYCRNHPHAGVQYDTRTWVSLGLSHSQSYSSSL